MMGTCKSPGAFRTGRCLQKTMTRNAKEEAGKEEAGMEEERISTCVINPRVRGTSASVLMWQHVHNSHYFRPPFDFGTLCLAFGLVVRVVRTAHLTGNVLPRILAGWKRLSSPVLTVYVNPGTLVALNILARANVFVLWVPQQTPFL